MTWTFISRVKHPEPPPWLYSIMARGSIMRLIYRRVVADLARHLPPGARVLDVGTGPGYLPTYLAEKRPDLQLWGLDFAYAMIRRARERRGSGLAAGAPRWLVADVLALPFPAGAFHHALATFSCHIWPQPAVGLAEMLRVLKPGGQAWVYELRREATLSDMRAFAVGARLPYPLVFLGFKVASLHHAIPTDKFHRLLTQAVGSRGRLRPVHHLFWRAELERS